ncbi:hypothetical protein COO60DRAFT_1002858 [Scenedesmus sp. NREL 46B-D3]|nr:hypothetical protein COO60DRAFT_1002858 [Scenedesmus sp. NREL 46B-D3]
MQLLSGPAHIGASSWLGTCGKPLICMLIGHTMFLHTIWGTCCLLPFVVEHLARAAYSNLLSCQLNNDVMFCQHGWLY